MAGTEVRVAEWLGFVSDLLHEPLSELPHDRLFDQLLSTFPATGVSYNWAGPDGKPDMLTRPEGILNQLADVVESWQRGEHLYQHPLVAWYLTTGDIRPTTNQRVPTTLVPSRTREPVMQSLRQVGLDQQLSISLSSTGFHAYVLGRQGSDFTDDDLLVARQIQRAIVGLDRHTELIRQLSGSGARFDLDAGLTPQEFSVLGLLAAGHSTAAIAHRLHCSPRTVHKHLEHVYRKLGVRDRVNALRVARLHGLT